MDNPELEYDYVLFAGKTKETMNPLATWQNKEMSIEGARRLLTTKVFKWVKVVYRPNDENKVIWANQ